MEDGPHRRFSKLGNYILTVPKNAMLLTAKAEPVSCGLEAEPLPVRLWQENPYGLVSLLDIMLNFEAAKFESVVSGARAVECICKDLGLGTRVPDHIVEMARIGVAHPAEDIALALKLTETAGCALRLSRLLDYPIESSALVHNVRGLLALFDSEMTKRLFFGIPPNLADHYEKERPFGNAVYDSFPSARIDLTEAGTCLACGRHVAAAFHLMRASEVALWELGRDRQIPLAKSGKIESSEWGKIIRELEIALEAIQQWPNSATKEEAHKLYNRAVVEIRAFNDGWRRHTAHVRPMQPQMLDVEALALWGHVSRFLTTLAPKISQGQYTALVWS